MGSGPPTTEKDTTSRSRRGRADSDANNTRTVSVHANQDDSDAGLERNEPDGEDGNGDLPMSKARCIALVATVTGAAFLNVSQSKCPEWVSFAWRKPSNTFIPFDDSG
ncbi:hypothetical protein J3459_019243 [Metarhizium acridum]|nr:hypothetical protein J3459_019243 [Metarhizium acridum]